MFMNILRAALWEYYWWCPTVAVEDKIIIQGTAIDILSDQTTLAFVRIGILWALQKEHLMVG
jgi:hypothetical protein